VSNSNPSVFLELGTHDARMREGLTNAQRYVNRFAQTAKHSFETIRESAHSLEGRVAEFGLTVGFAEQAVETAKMTTELTRAKQTVGATQAQMASMRTELKDLSRQTGVSAKDLNAIFDDLLHSGLSWDEARNTLPALAMAMRVTGASGEGLTQALTEAAHTFNFDLTKPGEALVLLDKMRVAAKNGHVQMDDLARTFGRVGLDAKRANMSLESTLALTEAFSHAVAEPRRLNALLDSTFGLFSDRKAMMHAQRKSGVQFFDKDGARRDVVDVLEDMRSKYSKFTTEQQQQKFMSKIFGGDTQAMKGMSDLLGGKALEDFKEIREKILKGQGTLNGEMPEAMGTVQSQAERLVATLRAGADGFIEPIERGFAHVTKKLLDSRKDGGFGFNSTALIAGGVGLTAAAVVLGSKVKGIFGGRLGKLLGLSNAGSTAAGIAEGKMLEKMTGVNPVFVTNWPSGGMGGPNNFIDSTLSKSATDFYAKVAAERMAGMTAATTAAEVLGGVSAATIAGMAASALIILGAGALLYSAVTQKGQGHASRNLTDDFNPDGSLKHNNFTSSVSDATAYNAHAGKVVTAQMQQELHGKVEEMFGLGKGSAGHVKNDISIEVNLDKSGRMMAEVTGQNTTVNLKRGSFGGPWDVR